MSEQPNYPISPANMADSSDAAFGASVASNASEQARIRRERREAKIKAGGASRLNKITGLGGGLQREEPAVASNVTPASTQLSTDDPAEVDISEHFYKPSQHVRQRATPTPNIPSTGFGREPSQIDDDIFRAMALGMAPSQGVPQTGSHPFSAFSDLNGLEGDDPMMAMMQKMIGANGSTPSLPSGQSFDISRQDAPASAYAYVWRIVHAVFAISLSIYIASTTGFSGTKLSREQGALGGGSGNAKQLFFIGEAILLATRFAVKGEEDRQAGIFGMLMTFIPQPWKGYLVWVLRYTTVFKTLSEDALTIIFVLGAACWLRT